MDVTHDSVQEQRCKNTLSYIWERFDIVREGQKAQLLELNFFLSYCPHAAPVLLSVFMHNFSQKILMKPAIIWNYDLIAFFANVIGLFHW